MSPSTKLDSSLSQFRDGILKVKMFAEGTSDSLKTQLATYIILFNYPRDEEYWRDMVTSGVITNEDTE